MSFDFVFKFYDDEFYISNIDRGYPVAILFFLVLQIHTCPSSNSKPQMPQSILFTTPYYIESILFS